MEIIKTNTMKTIRLFFAIAVLIYFALQTLTVFPRYAFGQTYYGGTGTDVNASVVTDVLVMFGRNGCTAIYPRAVQNTMEGRTRHL